MLRRLFGPREVTPPSDASRLDRLETAVRLLETEFDSLHGQVRKWMRRAVAADRRLDEREGVLSERDAGRVGNGPPAPVTLRDARRLPWRQRLEARRAAAREAREVAPQSTNGEG